MSTLSPTIHNAFGYYFQDFLQRVEALADGLSDEEFWTNPFPYGNSIGNLVLHITGNLNYYIGTQLAATGYVRDRDREFNATPPLAKAQALQELATAIRTVTATLEAQQDADWATVYVADGVDDVHDRFSIFLRCAVHFHHHIGHMSYVKDEHVHRRITSKIA